MAPGKYPSNDPVLDQVREGKLSYRQAASLLGCSFSWVRYRVDPEQLEKKREYDRAYGFQRPPLTGRQYNRWLLLSRRRQALKRIEKRNRERGEDVRSL